MSHFDLAVVGAGIVGLAHALAAVRRGWRVVVVDRDAQANGASIRNFGFVTVTGQEPGDCWRRAMRSREVWAEVAAQASIRVEHAGLAVAVRCPEAVSVLEAFAAGEMGRGCEVLSAAAARARFPFLRGDGLRAALWSPHELRVESRTAIPALARWLGAAHGVEIRRGTLVHAVDPPRIETSAGTIEAERCVVCPGDDFLTLFAERLAAYGLSRCKLHMLRVRPDAAHPRLTAAVMSDLGLIRYRGYALLPEATALRRRLEAERAAALAHGVHLIAVGSADGTLVVGDSHDDAATPDPFAPESVDRLILEELEAVLGITPPPIVERWIGTYATAPDRLMLVDRPRAGVRIVVVTSGTGASTAFAIAEEVVAELAG